MLKNALRGGEKLYPDTAKLAMEASLAVQDSSHQFLKLEQSHYIISKSKHFFGHFSKQKHFGTQKPSEALVG